MPEIKLEELVARNAALSDTVLALDGNGDLARVSLDSMVQVTRSFLPEVVLTSNNQVIAIDPSKAIDVWLDGIIQDDLTITQNANGDITSVSVVGSLIGDTVLIRTYIPQIVFDTTYNPELTVSDITNQTTTKGLVSGDLFGTAASRDVGTASGNVMEVGAGGLLGDAVNTLNLDTSITAQKYSAYKPDVVLGWPPQLNSYFSTTLLLDVTATGLLIKQTGTAANTGDAGRKLERVSSDGGVTWSDWQELYHSGNLNPNVFGGNFGSRPLVGYAENATTAVFILHTPTPAEAISVTQTGTFSVVKGNGGAITGGSSVTPTLSNQSGIGGTFLQVSGLSSLATDQVILLNVTSASATIEVNF